MATEHLHHFGRANRDDPYHGLKAAASHYAPISRPPRALMIASHGRVASRLILKARAWRRINPLFVGWVMGWPIGHALCACSATEFILWRQRMRDEFFAVAHALGLVDLADGG